MVPNEQGAHEEPRELWRQAQAGLETPGDKVTEVETEPLRTVPPQERSPKNKFTFAHGRARTVKERNCLKTRKWCGRRV